MAQPVNAAEEIIGIGAEAVLVKSSWFGRPCLIKKRLPKAYRLAPLDNMLRKQRTVIEVRALIDAKDCGVPTPSVFEADPDAGYIIMDFIEGNNLKSLLPNMPRQKIREHFLEIGRYIAKLHAGGIIHGDLTTSNIMVTPQQTLVFIDFGLSQRTETIEDRGVDVHLLKRVLTSTHASIWQDAYYSFIQGYGDFGLHSPKEIEARVREIELRGRYIKKEDRRKNFY